MPSLIISPVFGGGFEDGRDDEGSRVVDDRDQDGLPGAAVATRRVVGGCRGHRSLGGGHFRRQISWGDIFSDLST